jgi:hypothetical protein
MAIDEADRIARTTLDRNVQRIGPLRVVLKRVEVSFGQVSFYFSIVNEGMTDAKAMWFGGGSFGNGGSFLIARGQRVLASSIELGGEQSDRFITQVLYPNVWMDGRVDFRGVSVTQEDMDIFGLAYARANLRPDGAAKFQLNNGGRPDAY